MKKIITITALLMIVMLPIITSASSKADGSKNTTIEKRNSWSMLDENVYFQLQGGISVPFTKVDGQVGYGVNLLVGYQFTPVWGLRGIASYEKLRGENDNFHNPDYPNQPVNRSFKSDVFEASIDVTFDITQAIKKNTDRKYGIYPFVGIGGMWYYSQAFNTDTGEKFGDRNNFDKRLVPVGALGVGFKYSFARNWDFVAEFRASLANTKGVDLTGTNGNYPITAYSQLGVGVKYKIGTAKKTTSPKSKIE